MDRRIAKLEKKVGRAGSWAAVYIFMVEAEDGTRSPIDEQARATLDRWDQAQVNGYTGPEPILIILQEDIADGFR